MKLKFLYDKNLKNIYRKKNRFYWINRPKKEFRRLYWKRISFTNVSRSLALQRNGSGRFLASQPSVAPHVSIALPVEEERSVGWGISSNTRKAPLENTHHHPWTLAPSLHMGIFSGFGYPLAHLLLFLSFFLAESRDFLSDQHRGNNAYLTRDEHWFNQTLDHFSPTACLLFSFLVFLFYHWKVHVMFTVRPWFITNDLESKFLVPLELGFSIHVYWTRMRSNRVRCFGVLCRSLIKGCLD